jgi:hypothetical protein
MNTRQLARLGLGITGIWALVYALSGFIGLASLLAFQCVFLIARPHVILDFLNRPGEESSEPATAESAPSVP